MSQRNEQQQKQSVDRRKFLAKSAIGAAIAGATVSSSVQAQDTAGQSEADAFDGFNLKFAPHPGSFKAMGGKDVIDQIKFCHDQGFTALEYNGLGKETVEMQTKIGKTLAELKLTMGVFVGYANFIEPTFADPQKDLTQAILESMKQAVEIAARVNAKWFTVVPGSIDQQPPKKDGNKYGKAILAPGYQMANVVDLLRQSCEILEPHDLTMVLEPLNWHTNHGGAYLRYSDHAYAICKAVNSPSCKILFDIYHQQITEGNLIKNIEHCWDEIAYFQAGDNPGRKEPGTGEINYKNVFQYIHDRSKQDGREFVVGMEHGNSIKGAKGEQATIDAYKNVNPAVG
ncbi:MAG: TIM barrel protein [Planctomycetota bacterium]